MKTIYCNKDSLYLEASAKFSLFFILTKGLDVYDFVSRDKKIGETRHLTFRHASPLLNIICNICLPLS